MTDIKARLTEAADYLEYLFEGSKHVPDGLFQTAAQRGLVRGPADEVVAQFFYGGAADVFIALGPAALPLLARMFRAETYCAGDDGDHEKSGCTDTNCTALAALKLADYILKAKETET